MSASINTYPPKPVVALNGKIDVAQAQSILGCSYSYVIHLLHKKKIKGQRVNKRWLIDADDVYRSKGSVMTNNRAKPVKTLPIPIQENIVKVEISLPREVFSLLNVVFSANNKNMTSYLEDHLKGVFERVKGRLSEGEIL